MLSLGRAHNTILLEIERLQRGRRDRKGEVRGSEEAEQGQEGWSGESQKRERRNDGKGREEFKRGGMGEIRVE